MSNVRQHHAFGAALLPSLMMRARSQSGYSLLEIMLVCGLVGVISAIAVPMLGGAFSNFRLSGDARSVTNTVSLAKLQAASDFSKARLYVDLTMNAFHVETWNTTTAAWVTQGGTTDLSSGAESFGFGVVTNPPANTQSVIGQTKCLDALGNAIANTACIVFNSRGIPVVDAASSTGAPTANQALYLTDGTAVYGVTASATGSIRLWRTLPTATPAWTQQ
jgi:Tfp pilus assembly protein FimT